MSRTTDPLLSVVVPVFNEEGNLEELTRRLRQTFRQDDIRYEIILVDDGSTDGSLRLIRALHHEDDRIRYTSFSRNFGHEAASSCGMQLAKGDIAVLMDADLQDPPELIPQMLQKWRRGADVVCARRSRRDGETLMKRATSKWFYRLVNALSEVEIPLDVGDFRLVDRKVIDAFNRLTERNRFVRGLFSWVGFQQDFIEFDRPERSAGETKYSAGKLFLLTLDALFSFTLVPIRLLALFGLFVTAISTLLVLTIIYQKLIGTLQISGYALLSVGLFFLGGTILVFLGVIGEYVGKTYQEAQGRPLFVVRESSLATNETTSQHTAQGLVRSHVVEIDA